MLIEADYDDNHWAGTSDHPFQKYTQVRLRAGSIMVSHLNRRQALDRHILAAFHEAKEKYEG